MIRHPFNSAIGRTRADFNRVTDGIAASLRAFSTAQRLASTPQDGSNGDDRPQPTGRQRAAAAISDIVEMNKGVSPLPGASGNQRGGGGGVVFKKIDLRADAPIIKAPNVNIIRGGLRGGLRGRGRGGAASSGRGRGGGAMGPGRRGGGRRGRSNRDGDGKGGRGGRAERDQDADQGADDVDSPEMLAMRELYEIGVEHQFDPSIARSDLTGWGPAVPSAGSAAAKDETVLRQARILGDGGMFHPLHTLSSDDLWTRYKAGNGVFFPSEEVKTWSTGAMGLDAFPPVPAETKDAVLQDALLGTYQGPQYTDLDDTIGIVRNYVRKDATWNADAMRRVEAKIKSLLPGGRTPPPKAAGETKAKT